MKKLMLATGVAIAMHIGFDSLAVAQAPPTDMSWGIPQQMRLQQQWDMAARQAAAAYYN